MPFYQIIESFTFTEFAENPLTALLAATDYRAQVARYLDVAKRPLGVHPRPALCFLNVGGAVRVVTEGV